MALIKRTDKNWIQKAKLKKGLLRDELKAKKGEKIPLKSLLKASKKGGKLGKRANLALTLRKLSSK